MEEAQGRGAVDEALVVPVARDNQVEDAKRMIASKKSRLTLRPANPRYRFACVRLMCMVPEPPDARGQAWAEKNPRRAKHPGHREQT